MIRWLRKAGRYDIASCNRRDIKRPFRLLRKQVNDYVKQGDYFAIGEATYNDDPYIKGMIDWTYGNFKYSWAIKTYFNAGMFYGELFDYIVGYDPDYVSPPPSV